MIPVAAKLLLAGLGVGGIAFLAASKKAGAKTDNGNGQADDETPAGQPAFTPYGAGTYQEDGTVVLDNGSIVNPATGEVKPPPIDARSPGIPPVPSSNRPDVPVAPAGIPARIGERIARALATGDPVAMRAEANALKKDGYPEQGAGLLAAAIAIEQSRAIPEPAPITPPRAPASAPSVTIPAPVITPQTVATGGTYVVKAGDSPYKIAQKMTGDGNRYRELADANPSKRANILAGKIYVGEVLKLPATWVVAPRPTEQPTEVILDPHKTLAQQTQLMLSRSSIDNENKAQVKAYQLDNPESGAADGLYGPKTATSFFKWHIVPVTPFYWPKATATASRRDYKNSLLAQAVKDPVRAQEWQQAASAIK
jgi:nucleoid-associated protein YgaU